VFSSEQLSSSTSKGRFTLISAIVKHKDEVYRRLVDEFKTIENVHREKIQYHRSFTSKHILSGSVFSTTAQIVSNPTENTTAVSSLVLTRASRSFNIDWSVCVFCQCKTCKRDKKLHKITSDERTKRLLNLATLTDDGEMVYRITNDGFAENAVYHAICMTNYLLKRIKDDSEDYSTSEHDNLFQSFISTIKDDLLTHKNKKIFTLT
jgi:hypothetical protein